MSSDFDALMAEADEAVEAVMGEPVTMYHGVTEYPVQAIVDRSADAVHSKYTRVVRLRQHTVTLELRQAQLPAVEYTELEADVDGVRYHVVDDDIDNGWVLLALAQLPADPTKNTDTKFINLG